MTIREDVELEISAENNASAAFEQTAQDADELAREARRAARALDEFEQESAEAGQGVDNLGALITTAKTALGALAGALAVGEVAAFTSETFEAAAETQKWAERLGLTVEQLSRLEAVTRDFNIEADTLRDGLQTLAERVVELGEGGGEAEEAFSRLNITVDQLQGLTVDQVLLRIADAFSQTDDATGKLTTALQLFGDEAGSQFINVLNEGGAALENLARQAQDAGKVLSEEQAAAATEAADAISELSNAFSDLANNLALNFARPIADAVNGLNGLIDTLEEANRRILGIERDLNTVTLDTLREEQDRLRESIELTTRDIAKASAEIKAYARAQAEGSAAAKAAKARYDELNTSLDGQGRQLQAITLQIRAQEEAQRLANAATLAAIPPLDDLADSEENAANATRRSKEEIDAELESLRQRVAQLDETAAANKRVAASGEQVAESQREVGDAAEETTHTVGNFGNIVDAIYNTLRDLSQQAFNTFITMSRGVANTSSEAEKLEQRLDLVNNAIEHNRHLLSTGFSNFVERFHNVQQQFLEVAISVQRFQDNLTGALDEGAIRMDLLRRATVQAESALQIMDGSQLDPLNDAIRETQARFDELTDRIEGRTRDLAVRLAELRGDEAEAERIRLENDLTERRLAIEEDIALARQSGLTEQARALEAQLQQLREIERLSERQIQQRERERQDRGRTVDNVTPIRQAGSGSSSGGGITFEAGSITLNGLDEASLDQAARGIEQRINRIGRLRQ